VISTNGDVTIDFNQMSYGGLDDLVACGHGPASSSAFFQVYEPKFKKLVAIEQLQIAADGTYNAPILRFPAHETVWFREGTYTIKLSAGIQVQGTVVWDP
jgi:hypothetical protein